MATHTSAARFLLFSTLVLAVAGDILLRVEPWGINFAAVALLAFAGVGIVSRRLHDALPPDAWVIACCGLLCAACIAWRDSPQLFAFNLLATLAAVHLVTVRKNPGDLLRMTFFDHLHQSFLQVIHLTLGFGFLLLRDLHTESEEEKVRGRVWLGIVLAIPALLLFGSLLIAADAKFEYLITEVFHLNIWTLFGHAALVAFLSLLAGGWLRGRFLATEFAISPSLSQKKVSLGPTEIGILLGSLDVLFGMFVVIQIPTLFGGHAAVLGTPSLTYAEYARRGFFELIAVAALCLPLLLSADWLFHAEKATERRLMRLLAIVMVALVAVMLVSAMDRLSLYMEAYGLTTARVHAAAILIWISLTLFLFCVTVLRGKRNLLPFAMIVSGYVVLIGLNAVNPDALVARINITRLSIDGKCDTKYSFHLSADAVPVFLGAMSGLDTVKRSDLAEGLLQRYAASTGEQDVRTWNASRATAASLVREREVELRAYVLPRDTTGSHLR
jgi:hypothetical protein